MKNFRLTLYAAGLVALPLAAMAQPATVVVPTNPSAACQQALLAYNTSKQRAAIDGSRAPDDASVRAVCDNPALIRGNSTRVIPQPPATAAPRIAAPGVAAPVNPLAPVQPMTPKPVTPALPRTPAQSGVTVLTPNVPPIAPAPKVGASR